MLKRIKRLLKKRNNGGFTLVEVIVSSALLGILILGVIGFSQPVLDNVKAQEQNARAVMMCETIESYIAKSTRYAYYVQTFSGVVAEDTVYTSAATPVPIANAKYTGSEYIEHTDASLADMLKCLNETLNKENYEIRCIGMRWMQDPKNGEMKMMLTNEVVDQNTCALDNSKTKLVFESCFYDGLYPILEFKNYDNQYQVVDTVTGAVVDKFDSSDVNLAAGLEISMNVYLDSQCYSTDASKRQSAQLSYVGITYADYGNISRVTTINKGGNYKLHPNVELHTYDEAKAASASSVYVNEDYGDCYYPDTFIYYIAKKVLIPTTK